MGASAEQVDATFDQIMANEFFNKDGQRWASIEHYVDDMQQLNQEIDSQVESFSNARNSAIEHTQVLSNATVTHDDLINAKLALKHATDANIQGLIRMDSQTLDNLQNAIDSTQAKLDNFAKSAKTAADNLEATLAKMQGDDSKARQLTQTKKLMDIETKLQQAKQRGNTEEIKQLERALELQKQINREEEKQARERERQSKQRSTNSTTNRSSSRTSTGSSNRNNSSPIDVTLVADAWDERIRQAEARGAENALKQLRYEAQRRAR